MNIGYLKNKENYIQNEERLSSERFDLTTFLSLIVAFNIFISGTLSFLSYLSFFLFRCLGLGGCSRVEFFL